MFSPLYIIKKRNVCIVVNYYKVKVNSGKNERNWSATKTGSKKKNEHGMMSHNSTLSHTLNIFFGFFNLHSFFFLQNTLV